MFIEKLKNELNTTETTNGAVAYKSTGNNVINLFAQLGSMRDRTSNDKIKLFKEAYKEDKELALKILFYYRNCRGGQGERQTFRDIYIWLAQEDTDIAIANIKNIMKFGRSDDLIYIAYNAYKAKDFVDMAIKIIQLEINRFEVTGTVSLLGKWLPSINASSPKTKAQAQWLRKQLFLTPKEYRKLCTAMRKKLKLVENNLREKTYKDIDYEQVPSLALNKYRQCFERNDNEHYFKYLNDVKNGNAKINAKVLYPYDIVRKYLNEDDVDETLELQWKNLPNYVEGENINSLTVCDVSGSMYGFPIAVAISLSIYLAERCTGAYKNKFITFSERPVLVDIPENCDLYKKIESVNHASWGFNTNLKAVFDLILNIAKKYNLKQEDIPEQLIIITDMNFDAGVNRCNNRVALMDSIRDKFKNNGYKLPKLVWWNVNAINEVFPMLEEDGIAYVSGCSPVILKSVLNNKVISPMDVIKDTVLTQEYESVIFEI